MNTAPVTVCIDGLQFNWFWISLLMLKSNRCQKRKCRKQFNIWTFSWKDFNWIIVTPFTRHNTECLSFYHVMVHVTQFLFGWQHTKSMTKLEYVLRSYATDLCTINTYFSVKMFFVIFKVERETTPIAISRQFISFRCDDLLVSTSFFKKEKQKKRFFFGFVCRFFCRLSLF